MHFTEIRVRVLRSKDVLEKCKKGKLFLVVGAERERDSPCKRLLATLRTQRVVSLSPRIADIHLSGGPHLAKSRNDVTGVAKVRMF